MATLKERTRINLLKEFISTERSYSNSLTTFLECFVRPLAARWAPRVSPDATDSFERLEAYTCKVLSASKQLLTEMEDLDKSGEFGGAVGELFTRWAITLRIYSDYVTHHKPMADEYAALNTSNKKFRQVSAAVSASKEVQTRACGMIFESYLIMPVQRVPRYELLLSSLLKVTENNDPKYGALANAVAAIKHLAVHLNESVGRHEATVMVRDIQRATCVGGADAGSGGQGAKGASVVSFFSGGRKKGSAGPELSLVQPSRYYIAEGEFVITPPALTQPNAVPDISIDALNALGCAPLADALERGERCSAALVMPCPAHPQGGLRLRLFLFNDVLMAAVPRPGGVGPRVSERDGPNAGAPVNGPPLYELFTFVPISSRFGFTLTNEGGMHTLTVTSHLAPGASDAAPAVLLRARTSALADADKWKNEIPKLLEIVGSNLEGEVDVSSLVRAPDDNLDSNKRLKGFVTKNTTQASKAKALEADEVKKRAQNTVVLGTELNQPSLAKAVEMTVGSASTPSSAAAARPKTMGVQGQTAQRLGGGGALPRGVSAPVLAGVSSGGSGGPGTLTSRPSLSSSVLSSLLTPPGTPGADSGLGSPGGGAATPSRGGSLSGSFVKTTAPPPTSPPPAHIVAQVRAKQASLRQLAVATGGTVASGPLSPPPERVATLLAMTCAGCNVALSSDDAVAALGKNWHNECFRCDACDAPFRAAAFYEQDGKAFCKKDYLARYGENVCPGCMCALQLGDRAIKMGGRVYHTDHYRCEGCNLQLSADAPCYERDGAPYCSPCNIRLFGTCAGCGNAILTGEAARAAGAAVANALGRNWHQSCFCCTECQRAFDDGVYFTHADSMGIVRAYCEADYQRLFGPRCAACGQGVDRGLQVGGAAWHYACFKCSTCGCDFKDGNYYEVGGRPYCHTDYYTQFGPSCAGCNTFIAEDMVNACGATWHPACFACFHCKKPFPEEMEYFESDGKAYDYDCFCTLFCPPCPVCKCYVSENGRTALDQTYHAWCLKCSHCGEVLEDTVRQMEDGKFYCETDYLALIAKECARCNGVIERGELEALDKWWHTECFTCCHPGCTLSLVGEDAEFYDVGGLPYCAPHYVSSQGPPCTACGAHIFPGEERTVADKVLHPACFACGTCKRALDMNEKIYLQGAGLQCEHCFTASADPCATCHKRITAGNTLTLLGRKYHAGCLACTVCLKVFDREKGIKTYQRDGWPVCADHVRGELPPEGKARMAWDGKAID